jgi:hypothetical protein
MCLNSEFTLIFFSGRIDLALASWLEIGVNRGIKSDETL